MNYDRTKRIKNMSPGTKFFFSRIFPLIFFAVGLGLSYKGYSNFSLANESINWPNTDGVIISSEIRHKTSHSSKGGSSSTYHADIKYSYAVVTAKFTGDKVSYGDYGSSDRGHASSIVRRYPVGKKVKVYYKKDLPTEAVLEPGITGGAWLTPGIGVLFALIGIIMFIKMPSAMNKNKV